MLKFGYGKCFPGVQGYLLKLGYTPAQIFALGQLGGWYDPSDYATLFQDAAGTTPVTAVAQPVGWMLDKRLGLVLGPQLVTNGGFDANTTGWADNGAAITRVTTIFPGGGARVVAVTATNTYATQTISGLVIGKTYRISTQAFTPSGQGVDRATIGTQNASFSTAGSVGQKTLDTVQTLAINLVATAVTQIIYLAVVSENFSAFGLAGSVAHFDNVSFSELPGNHLSQATASARPLTNTQGATKYLTFDGIDDGLATGPITLGAAMDCFIAVRRNSAGNGYIASTAGSYFGFIAPGDVGLADGNVGTPTYTANGIAVNGGLTGTTRDQLATSLPVSSWVVLEIRNLNLATWATLTIANFSTIYLNGDIAGIILCPAGDATARQKNRQYLGNKVGLTLP